MPRWRRGLHDEARGWPGGGAAKGGRRGAAGDQAAPLCWLLCGGLGCAAAAGCCCVGIRPQLRRCLLGLLCGGLGCAAVAGFCCIDLVVLLCGVDLVGCIGRRCGGEGGSSVWVGSRIRSSTGSGGFPRATERRAYPKVICTLGLRREVACLAGANWPSFRGRCAGRRL